MSKNILYILEDDISQDTGSAINERGLVKKLLINEVSVLIPFPDKNLDKEILNNKFLFFTKKINRKNPIKYFNYLLDKIRKIKKITKENKIKTLVFRWGPIPIDILYYGRQGGYTIFLKHLTFLRTSQKDGVRFRVSAFLKKLIIKKGYINGADTPSLMTKQLILDKYKINNILVAKNGTDKESFVNKKREREFIYIGRLSKKRNTDKLLEAFKNSKRTLDIYGFGELVPEVKEYAKKYENINFYGKVDFERLKKELPYYQFGVDFTYVPTSYGKASYSQKIAQYLSFGLNVIAIDCIDNKFIEENQVGKLIKLKDKLTDIIDNIKYKEFDDAKLENYIYTDAVLTQRIQLWQSLEF